MRSTPTRPCKATAATDSPGAWPIEAASVRSPHCTVGARPGSECKTTGAPPSQGGKTAISASRTARRAGARSSVIGVETAITSIGSGPPLGGGERQPTVQHRSPMRLNAAAVRPDSHAKRFLRG